MIAASLIEQAHALLKQRTDLVTGLTQVQAVGGRATYNINVPGSNFLLTINKDMLARMLDGAIDDVEEQLSALGISCPNDRS